MTCPAPPNLRKLLSMSTANPPEPAAPEDDADDDRAINTAAPIPHTTGPHQQPEKSSQPNTTGPHQGE